MSYANQHRLSSSFRALFFKVRERFHAQGFLSREKGKFKFNNKLLAGLLHHHPVPELVPLGRVQAGQGRDQGSHHAGPRRIYAQLYLAHRGQGG
ncbi:hypothetical protein DFAR_630059 [Desulfarculales bacterium]